MVSSKSNIVNSNLTDLWAEFNPDLPDEDDPPVDLDDLWSLEGTMTTDGTMGSRQVGRYFKL